MDTTNKYIEMCKAARKELQWSPTNGDTIYIPLGIKYEEYNDYGEGVQEEPKTIHYYDVGGRYYSFNHIYMEGLVVGTVFSEWPHGRRYKLSDVVWLPHQDQLQGMLKESHTMGAIIGELYEFYLPERLCLNEGEEYRTCKCKEIGIKRRKMFDSIEQLWLAVVMRESHKKEWDGIEWKDAQGRVTK